MLVAELTGLREFQLVDRPTPEPAAGELQVRVSAIGICGSDLHYYAEGAIGDTTSRYPMVLGHEPSGVITKVGSGVTGWAAGDRVTLEPAIFCYHCEFCRAGRHNVCENVKFLSSPDYPGFFREYVNIPATNVHALPPELGFAYATMHEPLGVILHSMEFAAPRAGDTAAVFGAGPIGLLTIAVLKLSGVRRIWAVEPLAHRRELAKHMGADAVIDPLAVDPVKEILHDTGNRGVDAAIDCVAKGNTINQSLHVARNFGRAVITGVPSEIQIPLDFHVLRRKEVIFYTVRRAIHDGPKAIQMLAERPDLFAPLVTHHRPLDGICGAFNMLEHYSDGVGKIVLTT